MEKFNDSNLEEKIEPIVLWGIIVIICLFTVLIIYSRRASIFANIINEIFERGMIDEFQKLLLIRRWS